MRLRCRVVHFYNMKTNALKVLNVSVLRNKEVQVTLYRSYETQLPIQEIGEITTMKMYFIYICSLSDQYYTTSD